MGGWGVNNFARDDPNNTIIANAVVAGDLSGHLSSGTDNLSKTAAGTGLLNTV